MALGSLVWDASATMIDVPLENAVNMCSVWTAWFQFWGKPHLHIFPQYFECAAPHRVGSTGQAKKKATTPRHCILCALPPDVHLKFKFSGLNSNVDFYLKFDEYSFFFFFDSPNIHIHTHTYLYTTLHKYWNSKDKIALLAVESRHLQIWFKRLKWDKTTECHNLLLAVSTHTCFTK